MSLHLTGLGASHLVPPAFRLRALHPGLTHLGSRRVESNRQMRGEKRRRNIVVKKEGQHGARERTGRLKPKTDRRQSSARATPAYLTPTPAAADKTNHVASYRSGTAAFRSPRPGLFSSVLFCSVVFCST